MSRFNKVELDQNKETPVQFVETGKFHYRYAYARSADCQEKNDPGQDYLILSAIDNRFVFALCDGVSQSFYGDLASQILGENLHAYFAEVNSDLSIEQLQTTLLDTLKQITTTAKEQVANYKIPENVPPMLKVALEKKRAIGSESTFIAGMIDLKLEKAYFAWMGDSRLFLWKDDQEISKPFEGKFHTSERWSSMKGPVGDLHTVTLPISEFNHLATYSDGFSGMDKMFRAGRVEHPFSHHAIQELMQDEKNLASSDDISFLELWVTTSQLTFPSKAQGNITPDINHKETKGGHSFSWQEIEGATKYEVKFSSQTGTLEKRDTQSEFWLIDESLNPNATFFSVRAWYDSEPGDWSVAHQFRSAQSSMDLTPKPTTHSDSEVFPNQVIDASSNKEDDRPIVPPSIEQPSWQQTPEQQFTDNKHEEVQHSSSQNFKRPAQDVQKKKKFVAFLKYATLIWLSAICGACLVILYFKPIDGIYLSLSNLFSTKTPTTTIISTTATDLPPTKTLTITVTNTLQPSDTPIATETFITASNTPFLDTEMTLTPLAIFTATTHPTVVNTNTFTTTATTSLTTTPGATEVPDRTIDNSSTE